MLEARLAKLRQKKMKKSKEDGTEEEGRGTARLRFLTSKGGLCLQCLTHRAAISDLALLLDISVCLLLYVMCE